MATILGGPAALPISLDHAYTGADRICSLVHPCVFTSAISALDEGGTQELFVCTLLLRKRPRAKQQISQRVSTVQPCNKTSPQHPIMTPIWPWVVGATSMYVTHHIPSLLARKICLPQVPAWVFCNELTVLLISQTLGEQLGRKDWNSPGLGHRKWILTLQLCSSERNETVYPVPRE